jgi:hypothetical protein
MIPKLDSFIYKLIQQFDKDRKVKDLSDWVKDKLNSAT